MYWRIFYFGAIVALEEGAIMGIEGPGQDVLELYAVSDRVFKNSPEIQSLVQKICEQGYDVVFGFEVAPSEKELSEHNIPEPIEEVAISRLGNRCRVRSVPHRKAHH